MSRKRNKQTNRQVIEKEKTSSTGIYVSGGEIQSNDLDTVTWEDLRKDYDNMMKDTPALSSSYNILCYPVEAAKPRIDPGPSGSETAKEAAQYIDNCWNSLEKGFTYILRHALLALPNGLQMFEKIVKTGDE